MIKDVFTHNRKTWNKQVSDFNRWTIAVSSEQVAHARIGRVDVMLTPKKRVPPTWLGQLAGRDILGLASGGGQQVPLFAAAGANVTSFDLSDEQLAQDRMVAERENLAVTCVQGNMAEAWPFAAESFDLIFNPVSLCFVPSLDLVWREASRVLRPGGVLLCGFINPMCYAFDFELKNRGIFTLKYPLPFSDLTSLSEAETTRFLGDHAPLEFSHSLTDYLQGPLNNGFLMSGLYEDEWGGDAVDGYFPSFLATRFVLPQ